MDPHTKLKTLKKIAEDLKIGIIRQNAISATASPAHLLNRQIDNYIVTIMKYPGGKEALSKAGISRNASGGRRKSRRSTKRRRSTRRKH